MSESRLQAALDRSIARASALTRSLFERSPWDAARVVAWVNSVRTITVCTTIAPGQPHATVVIAGCIDGDIHFTVSDESLLQRNLARGQRVAFTICDRGHAVIGRGDAVFVARSLDDPNLIARLASVTVDGRFTPPRWDGALYRIEIDRIFAS